MGCFVYNAETRVNKSKKEKGGSSGIKTVSTHGALEEE